jgi:hypothetical protein
MLPLLLLGAGNAISGDRPGLMRSSTLVPVGMQQIETGLAFDWPRGASDVRSFPVTWRYGSTDDLELRASTSWEWLDVHGAEDEHGLGPLTLGVKGAFGRSWADLDLSWADSAAWVAELRVPAGSLGGAQNSLAPSVGAVASWTPEHGPWQMRSSVGLTYETDGGSMVFDLAAGASRPIGEQTSLYLEAGWFPRTRVGPDPLLVGGGLVALASRDVQLDIGFDAGVGDASGDWLAGVGICWRW